MNSSKNPVDSPDTGIRMVRVAVVAGCTQTDMTLPADIAIGRLIFDLIQVLGTKLHEQGKDVSLFRSKTPGRWALSAVGMPPMADGKTLSELGVYDGDLLVLTRARAAEEFQPLVDDVFDAASLLTESRSRPWDSEMSERIGGVIAVIACSAAAGLIGLYSMAQRAMWVPALTAVVASMFTVAAAWVADQRYQRPRLTSALVLGSYPLAGVGGAAIVPGPWGPFHLVLCAGALIGVATVAAVILKQLLALEATVMTVAGIVLAAALARAFWSVDYAALGIWVTLSALVVLSNAPKIGLFTARVPLPPVPTLGVTLTDDPDKCPRFIVAGSPDAQQYKAPGAEAFEQRTKAANLYLTGTIVGSSICAVAGTALAAQPGHHRYWASLVFSLFVGAILLRRARIYSDRNHTATMLVAGSAIVAVTVLRWALADARMSVVLAVSIGLLLVAGAVLVAGVTLPRARFNDVQRRVGELLELGVIAAVYPLGLWVAGVLGALRSLR
ncbi:type VII secretion integral membrane protein EccD [Mycobacterium kansasii]